MAEFNDIKFKGRIDGYSDLKAGLKRSDLNNEVLKSIFDAIDTANEDGVKDGVLDEKETKSFMQKIIEFAKGGRDKNLSLREAKKLLQDLGFDNLNGKVLFDLLNTFSQNSNKIEKTVLNESNNSNLITYTDGHTEEIFQDGSKILTVKNGNKTTVTKQDKEGKVISKTETTVEDGVETVIEYEGETPKSKTVTDTNSNKISNYTLENYQETLVQEENAETGDITTYQDGVKTITKKDGTVIVEREGETITTNPDGSLIVEKGDVKTTTSSDKNTITVESKDSKVVTVKKPEENAETITTEDNDGTITVLNRKDNKNILQTVAKDGVTYSVEYDGNGNTKGVVVQNGESPALVAKRFGCDLQKLIEVNSDIIKGKAPNQYFLVGADIVIPGEISADKFAELNKGRKGKTESIKGYTDFIAAQEAAKKQAEAQAKAKQAKETQSTEEKVRLAQVAQNRKDGVGIAADLYKDMDGLGTSKTFDEHLRKISADNVASVVLGYYNSSPDESIAEAIIDERGYGNIYKRVNIIEDKIYEPLRDKAKSLGIDTSHYEDEFKKARKIACSAPTNYKGFDSILKGLAAAIQAAEAVTTADNNEIAKLGTQGVINNTVGNLETIVNDSKESFKEQQKIDGWAGKAVDWMSQLWKSENRKELVDSDITEFEEQVATLKNCKNPDEFKNKFKEIFGVDYNEKLVYAYQKRSERQAQVNSWYSLEQSFNTEMKVLLSNSILRDETKTRMVDNICYTDVITSKELVYWREYNKLVEFLGKENVEKFFNSKGITDSSSLQDKWYALHELANDYSKELGNKVLKSTDNEGYATFTAKSEAMYNAAFGPSNGIAKRVQDYNISQQTGALVLKSGIKIAGAIAVGVASGGSASGLVVASLATTAISAGVDITDRVSSEEGLKEGEIENILKNAAIDGATVFAGGQLTKMLAKASTFVKLGGQLAGDVVTGAAAEYLQTGTITLSGVAFQAVFSAAGNLVALKQIKNIDNNVEVQTKQNSHPKDDKPKYVKPEKESTLEKATRDGNNPAEIAPQGVVPKLSDEKFAAAKQDLRNDLDKIKTIEDSKLAQLRKRIDAFENREQQRELQKMFNDKVETLKKSNTSNPSKTPLDNYQEQTVNDILFGKGPIRPENMEFLDKHLNSLNTVLEIEYYIKQLEKRIGTDNNGKLFVDMVQGKDHGALAMQKAKAKLNSLKASTDNYDDLMNILDGLLTNNKGLSGDNVTSVKTFVQQSSSVEELKNVLEKLNRVKSSNVKKSLVKLINVKIESLNGNGSVSKTNNSQAVDVESPSTTPSSSNSREELVAVDVESPSTTPSSSNPREELEAVVESPSTTPSSSNPREELEAVVESSSATPSSSNSNGELEAVVESSSATPSSSNPREELEAVVESPSTTTSSSNSNGELDVVAVETPSNSKATPKEEDLSDVLDIMPYEKWAYENSMTPVLELEGTNVRTLKHITVNNPSALKRFDPHVIL